MQTMEQFSHDLTLALEETSRMSGVRDGRWGQRRRTRSTGNLPCAPQPTEDSSSSPTDCPNDINNQNGDIDGSVHSDSDDRQDFRLLFQRSRFIGNFESDSVNENFSPARFIRPITRRKRKLKRMAIEYETTPSTPGTIGDKSLANPQMFPLTGAVKKRVLKHSSQDTYRTNLIFCGKRKRSHRDRYYDHDHKQQQSSSVPRQSHIFSVKSNVPDHKSRPRSYSSTTKQAAERILPLNKGLVSKIERIAQQQKLSESPSRPFTFTPIAPCPKTGDSLPLPTTSNQLDDFQSAETSELMTAHKSEIQNPKSVSFRPSAPLNIVHENIFPIDHGINMKPKSTSGRSRKHKNHRIKREQIRAQFQFDDPNSMECNDFADFLSSSSLSSSDSEDCVTNDTDREGDDELTDWPGNEVMINFASKNDFKRKQTKKTTLPLIKSDDYAGGGEEDTLMSGDEIVSPTLSVNFPSLFLPSSSNKPMQSAPITICNTNSIGNICNSGLSGLHLTDETQKVRFPVKQIESEMSGETSNPFLSTTSMQPIEIREIRFGCRRVKDERPGFTIKTSVNERLAKFLQDGQQSEIRLPDIEIYEQEGLTHLAKLYSLQISIENECAILKKTSNTTQSVKVEKQNLHKCLFLNEYKRRCYDDRTGSATSFNNDLIRDSSDVSSTMKPNSLESQLDSEFCSPSDSVQS